MHLDLNKQIELKDSGTYVIPTTVLRTMPVGKLHEAEHLIQRLVETNPEFTFYIEHEVMGGIRISWRRKDNK